ncbi:MAG: stage II sporulation protein M [Myxococcota bacterium]
MIAGPPSRTEDLEPPGHDRTTTLAALLTSNSARDRDLPGLRWLFFEAALFTGVSLVVSQGLGLEQPGVIALFLAAGALGSRAKEILHLSETAAESRASTQLLALFAGISLAYAGAAATLPAPEVARSFAFALEAADVDGGHLLERAFPGVAPVFGHNLVVLATVMVLSFVYRSFGALLAVAWNAAVWGTVLTVLLRRAVDAGDGATALVLGLAILPHLGLEAYGYVVGGLAGARLGRQLTRRTRLALPFRAAGTAAATLLLAAIVEATVPPTLRGWLDDSTSTRAVRCMEAERWTC